LQNNFSDVAHHRCAATRCDGVKPREFQSHLPYEGISPAGVSSNVPTPRTVDAAHCDVRNPVVGFFWLETGFFLLLRETKENDCGHARATTRGGGAFANTPER
jgi:hypothetical protein